MPLRVRQSTCRPVCNENLMVVLFRTTRAKQASVSARKAQCFVTFVADHGHERGGFWKGQPVH
jgi:hypothetical protein